MKCVALAGGVGGAKMLDGLAQVLPPGELKIIVNTGDDFNHLGLRICPDLDTICYTLAGVSNPETGWGRANESWNALETISMLGGPTWFQLGDRDLGFHLERTRRLKNGEKLSEITADFCRSLGIANNIFPMSDMKVPTQVITNEGELPFQEYFVRRQCSPRVTGFLFENVERATAASGVVEAIQNADIILICPSNPWVSIDPILNVPGIRQAVKQCPRVTAVSPIVGGKAIKGPAAKMYNEMGIEASALAVARHYEGLITGFVLDKIDEKFSEAVKSHVVKTLVTNTIMKDRDDRRRLAEETIEFSMH